MTANCWKANYTETCSLGASGKQGTADFLNRLMLMSLGVFWIIWWSKVRHDFFLDWQACAFPLVAKIIQITRFDFLENEHLNLQVPSEWEYYHLVFGLSRFYFVVEHGSAHPCKVNIGFLAWLVPLELVAWGSSVRGGAPELVARFLLGAAGGANWPLAQWPHLVWSGREIPNLRRLRQWVR